MQTCSQLLCLGVFSHLLAHMAVQHTYNLACVVVYHAVLLGHPKSETNSQCLCWQAALGAAFSCALIIKSVTDGHFGMWHIQFLPRRSHSQKWWHSRDLMQEALWVSLRAKWKHKKVLSVGLGNRIRLSMAPLPPLTIKIYTAIS